jgi:hypothetical protein
MLRRIASISLMLAVAMTLAAQAYAADIGTLLENKEGPDNFQIIRVAQLAKLMADPSSKVQIFDANHPSTRGHFGVIPGAHLLSSSDNYEVAKELPADKNAKLVFYCSDPH